jgi:hypothetical protein
MKLVANFFKNNLKTIEILITVVSFFTSISGFFSNLISLEIILFIFFIGFFISIIILLNYLSEKSENNTRRLKLYRILGILKYLIIIPILFYGYKGFIYKKPICEYTNQLPVILITNFTNEKNDDLSYAVLRELNDQILELDSIEILHKDTFITINKKMDSQEMENLLINNCFNNGLIVFGKRSIESNFLDCTIYLSEKLKNSGKTKEIKNFIRLKNPYEINFSIENQSKSIADFIIGLIFYYSDNFDKCLGKFSEIEKKLPNKEESKLKELCSVFISNSIYYSKGIEEGKSAIVNYLSNDSSSADLNYNYAKLLVSSGDTLLGGKYYRVANKLDYKLEIPNYIINYKSDIKKESNKSTSTENEISINDSKNKLVELNPKKEVKKDSTNKKEFKTEIASNNIVPVLPRKNIPLYPLKIVGPQGQKWLEDQRGKRITRNFEIIKLINKQYFAVSQYQMWGALDTLGKAILPMQFESFRELNKMFGD